MAPVTENPFTGLFIGREDYLPPNFWVTHKSFAQAEVREMAEKRVISLANPAHRGKKLEHSASASYPGELKLAGLVPETRLQLAEFCKSRILRLGFGGAVIQTEDDGVRVQEKGKLPWDEEAFLFGLKLPAETMSEEQRELLGAVLMVSEEMRHGMASGVMIGKESGLGELRAVVGTGGTEITSIWLPDESRYLVEQSIDDYAVGNIPIDPNELPVLILARRSTATE